MIDAVIFDIDGTLVNSVDLHAEAWRQALAHFGYTIAYDDVRRQIGKGADQLMPALIPRSDIERRGQEIESFRGTLFKREFLPQVRAFPHVADLLRRVRADGLRVALASSAKGDELAAYKRIAGIEDLIHSETSSDDAERSKPYPDIFQAALAALRLEPERAVTIGDTPYDAEAATGAGIVPIGVLCGGFSERDLMAAGCRQIFADPAALLRDYESSLIARGRSPAK